MIKVMVTYKVKPDRVQENEELVKAVYDELRQNKEPESLQAAFEKAIKAKGYAPIDCA